MLSCTPVPSLVDPRVWIQRKICVDQYSQKNALEYWLEMPEMPWIGVCSFHDLYCATESTKTMRQVVGIDRSVNLCRQPTCIENEIWVGKLSQEATFYILLLETMGSLNWEKLVSPTVGFRKESSQGPSHTSGDSRLQWCCLGRLLLAVLLQFHHCSNAFKGEALTKSFALPLLIEHTLQMASISSKIMICKSLWSPALHKNHDFR
jgi:hypothetical protein